MLTLNAITMISNGLTLALALGFLLILLWHDAGKEQNQFFGAFLFLVVLWNLGSLLVQASSLMVDVPVLVRLATSVMEMGFTGASVAIYILTTILIGIHSRRFRILAFLSLLLIVGYRVFLIVMEIQMFPGQTSEEILSMRLQPLFLVFYLIFDLLTIFVLWRYRRRIQSRSMAVGIVIFVIGQGLIFFNPTLIVASLSTSVGSFGALLLSFAIIQQEIIKPLTERNSQVEAMHRVSLAISSQIAIQTLLDEIAVQAVGWLRADAAGIYLKRAEDGLELVAVHHLPAQLLGTRVAMGQGVAGVAAVMQHSLHLENYQRDWTGEHDFALAKETFGSLICVPLSYAGEIIGVLMVVAGKQGRLFQSQDVYLLELLGAQAAVAIAHSQLFAEQQALTEQVEEAHGQLKTLLTSTENPVVAVDRDLRLIFANPAATVVFPMQRDESIRERVPKRIFPEDFRQVMREIRLHGGYAYEVTIGEKIYLCHLATLGRSRVEGWVAVLNDVTQLKELDRLKSEMVRMASHDLKNPLMGALAYVDLLRDDLSAIPNEKATTVNEAVDTIEWQLERMHRIIGGILELEKMQSALSSVEACQPDVVIEEALKEMRHYINDKGVQVICDIPEDTPDFWGDQEQFKRALVNLLENAVKFTLEDGRVEIRVYEADNMLTFEIKDNGVGIPVDLRPRVFDRFFRGQQKGVEHITGTGLGLSLVKTIIDNHKGKIWLESAEGVGTTFYVAVPSVYNQIRKANFSYSQ